MKQPGVLVVLITFVLVISFVVASQEAKNDGFVSVALTGAADGHGSGVFKFKVKKPESQLCYELSTSNIALATSAAVFSSEGSNVSITLDPPTNGRSQGCVSTKADTLADIAANPGRYYVNVMNAEFPNGAIRGQLK